MSTISPMTYRRWAPHAIAAVHSAHENAESMAQSRVEPGTRMLVGSTHAVCLCSNAHGWTTARGEWDLAFTRDASDQAGSHVSSPERIRFRADAAQLRNLALAMLAGARELDAIEAHVAPADRELRIDLDYFETITLTENGVGPSCESSLYVEPER